MDIFHFIQTKCLVVENTDFNTVILLLQEVSALNITEDPISKGAGFHRLAQSSSTLGLLTFGASYIVVGAVLCLAGYFAAFLASTH